MPKLLELPQESELPEECSESLESRSASVRLNCDASSGAPPGSEASSATGAHGQEGNSHDMGSSKEVISIRFRGSRSEWLGMASALCFFACMLLRL